jgi:hypothetical protein
MQLTYQIGRILTISILLSLTLSIVSAHAGGYSCSKTLRAVNLGDTMETVKAVCGDPITVATNTIPVNTPVQVTRWVYVIRTNGNRLQIPLFSVDFQNQKVVQVEKNTTVAPLLGGFSCVDSGMLKAGLSMEEVTQMCGSPSSASNTTNTQTSTKSVIVWTYEHSQFHPKAHFEFQDGKLTKINR